MSALVRLHRALRARDAIHWIAWGAHRNDAKEELLYHLDAFLLMLAAALDSTARSTYLIYDLGANPRHQSWTTLLGRKELRSLAPELVASVGDNHAVARRSLIALLRNSIHEEPLHGLSHATPSITVAVPEHMATDVVDAANRAGSLEEFGVLQSPGGVRIKPGRFVEAMVRHTIQDIDAGMAATDVSRLAVGEHRRPSTDDASFGSAASFSVLAFTGLTNLATV